MSAGAFKRSKYAASYGGGSNIHPIRIQPETESASIDGTDNAPPTGNTTSPVSALVSRGNRSLGLQARMVALRSPATNPPAGYKADSVTRIPALNINFYNAAEQAEPGATCSYLGASFTIVGVSPERVR